MGRFVGIDVGAETIKIAEVAEESGALRVVRRELADHGKDPRGRLVELLRSWGWEEVAGAAVTGRLGRQVALTRLPVRQALLAGYRTLHGEAPATVVSIGSRGFSVLEIRASGQVVFRENSRCAQGTGNFLRQLVERFGLDVEEASRLADGVADAAPLSGRCPVILKTDMTHLANKGEKRERILAGLLDAIAENVEVLVKPRTSPGDVFLGGGVARAPRVRAHFRRFLERNGLRLADGDAEDGLFLEAVGCAAHAARSSGAHPPPPLEALFRPAERASLEMLPPPSSAFGRVRRMTRPPSLLNGSVGDVVLGLDIGSTGSKAVALDLSSGTPAWEGYLRTNGDPVGAAQALVREFLAGPLGTRPVKALGATGSGREIVGSLLTTCYGADAVYVLNEIAAHAEGALHYDPRVDTIFEIGGQDAKYVRLAGGRVVDAAMNEACSAGTGSFIEEQGRRFEGVEDVTALAKLAEEANAAVALGQHCSIFMAEVIDEAVGAGVERGEIVAGIYDSVVANYLNRVKGNRSVGEVVFCQGMPFSADALAAAVARQTGAEVIVPPSPGTVGALGIALLAARSLPVADGPAVDPRGFLEARLERKDAFVCAATTGCGGAGNKCRIDRITTLVREDRKRFTWGGACSLYDKGTRRKKLPDLAPDPFREREALVAALVERVSGSRGGRRIALTDEFQLKTLFPFFATFLHGLGLDLQITRHAGVTALKRGIEQANVPFCAPMQQFHGLVSAMAEGAPDLVFVPMVREVPFVGGEPHSKVCPITQASPDILKLDLGPELARRIVATVVEVGPDGLDGAPLEATCRRLAEEVGVTDAEVIAGATAAAREAQLAFDAALEDIGVAALERCERDGLLPVVVLGRAYTIHNDVLNSNVPAILREQGAIAIPVDCYPVAPEAPIFTSMFWGYGQRIMRAAWQIRRTPGVYSLFASNYSCGPDSFTLHFYGKLMEGRPFAVIETDGHAGDAGTKTRVEAFLHCVREDLRAATAREPFDEGRLTVERHAVPDFVGSGERVLVPWMGPATDAMAATFRGAGIDAEALQEPTREMLHVGRRHTSGKECLPLALTIGTFLDRIERDPDPTRRFVAFMPGAEGPCRFGVYKEMHQLVLDRLGLSDRVRIWSPPSSDYFEGAPPGLGAIVLAGVTATDRLRDMRTEIRPGERRPGTADAVYARYTAELLGLLEREAGGDLSVARTVTQVLSGRVFGVPALLARAAREFAAARGPGERPLVLIAGEIYVRNVEFSNGGLADALAERGIATHVATISEYLQYANHNGLRNRGYLWKDRLKTWMRSRIEALCHAAAARPMGWAPVSPVEEVLHAAGPYLHDRLEGEAILTIGTPVHEHRERQIDAVVAVGPLECMPNKIAEAQLHHAGEREGLLSLGLSVNGDPVPAEVLDSFAFEVHARFQARRNAARS